MTTLLRAACIQMESSPDIEDNMKTAERLIRAAAERGAQLIATPENSCCMREKAADKIACAPVATMHPALLLFSQLAQELGVWILAGSLSIRKSEGDSKLYNRSYLFDATGARVASYDKIHLFDVDLPTGERRRESETVIPGTHAIVAQSPWGKIGLSICYDVRFAYLYRAMAQAGAKILTVPAAFTVPTGQAHWEILLRARAIETGSFVLAPAQGGTHEGGRKTWGHSLIIGPWGEILAQGAAQGEDIIMADLDMEAVDKARAAIPALRHDRVFTTEIVGTSG